MIKLDSTSKSLEAKLDSNVGSDQSHIFVSYTDISQSDFGLSGVGASDTETNNTTAVTIVSAPPSSTTRKVDFISIYNKDNVTNDVTVQLNNGTEARVIVKQALLPDETLQYADGKGWSII